MRKPFSYRQRTESSQIHLKTKFALIHHLGIFPIHIARLLRCWEFLLPSRLGMLSKCSSNWENDVFYQYILKLTWLFLRYNIMSRSSDCLAWHCWTLQQRKKLSQCWLLLQSFKNICWQKKKKTDNYKKTDKTSSAKTESQKTQKNRTERIYCSYLFRLKIPV